METDKKSQIATTSLLSQWKSKNKADAASIKIEKAPDNAIIPLSHGQRRLWFLQQLYPESAFYNYSERYLFKGKLIVHNLLKALNQVCNDHEILRSTYQLENGEPCIKIAPNAQIRNNEYDFSNLEIDKAELEAKVVMNGDAQHAFTLAEHPLVLVSIIKIHEARYIMLLTLHHISTDKWSMGILRTALASYYKALSSNKLITPAKFDVQYGDFTFWQKNQDVNSTQLAYWKKKLSGEIKAITLPTDFRKPATPSFKGGASPTQFFSKELSTKILGLAIALEVTPYVLLLSAYYILLYRYSGQKDIFIGSPVASRDQKAIEKLIGFFNDTVVLRATLDPAMSFKVFVQEVKQLTLEAFSNKDVPFDILVKELKQERSLALNPFFQVMFLYHAVPETPSFGPDLELEHGFFDAGVSKFDLTLYVSEENGILSSTFEYTTDLFKAASIYRFQKHLKNVLEEIVVDHNQPVSTIPMLTPAEKQVFRKQNTETKNQFEEAKAIHTIIAEIAKQFPDRKAVTYMGASLTYFELNESSNRLASYILSKTKKSNEIVGLCMERSLDLIVGMLAILKAGCAYLPIDPKYPQQRIEFMLQDAEIRHMVTQDELLGLFETFDLELITVGAQVVKDAIIVEFPEVESSALAYMIYTSGSTGNPKGVPISHKNIINSTEGRLRFYDKNPEAFLLMSSISFDSSKAGIFWTLCTGGNLVIAESRIEQDIERIESIISENNITHTLMLPSLYNVILEHGNVANLKSLNTVMVAGEICSSTIRDLHFEKFENVNLYNEYGPTEATVWCIAHKMERSETLETIPIGKPVANAEIYLLDENRNQVPFGVVGEIYVGGPGLASSYFKRPDLTNTAFIENPFSNSSQDRLYKTGDLGKCSPDGNIEFLGRVDQQVKIRGYRIEVNEIERVITEYGTIEQAVVLVQTFGLNQSKRLVAYVSSDQEINIDALKITLKKRLPEYMVPPLVSQVAKIPTLPNGKIDKKTLHSYEISSTSKQNSKVSVEVTELESKLLKLWKEVLQIDRISVLDNFFDLGGDSILSIQFITKARKEGLVLSPNQIFDYQTISKLAAFLEAKENQNEEWDYLVALRKEGNKKPLFCIHAGGGHIFFYNVLTKHIDVRRPIYALQASGVYANQNMHKTIEEMAVDYLKAMQSVQPNGPYNIVVYCFSVAVGHQIASLLSKQGEMANLIVMDTMADPWNLNTPKRLKMRVKGFVKRSIKNPVSSVTTMIGDRWVYLKAKINGIKAEPEEKALLEMNANLASICKAYTWNKVQGKVSIVLTEKAEESINTEIVDSWKELIQGEVVVTRTKGVHRNLFEEPDIKGVSDKIDAFVIE